MLQKLGVERKKVKSGSRYVCIMLFWSPVKWPTIILRMNIFLLSAFSNTWWSLKSLTSIVYTSAISFWYCYMVAAKLS